VLRVLCRYAFAVLGLHSVSLGTVADNHAMVKSAERAGFRHAGVRRDAVWIMGRFVDAVAFDLLASEWSG
jgi:RimJ/RimL family protein N-acetyltransferase